MQVSPFQVYAMLLAMELTDLKSIIGTTCSQLTYRLESALVGIGSCLGCYAAMLFHASFTTQMC